MTKLQLYVRNKFKTQEKFAKSVGINRTMAHNYLTGKTPMTLDFAIIIADKLGCEIQDIHDFVSQEAKP